MLARSAIRAETQLSRLPEGGEDHADRWKTPSLTGFYRPADNASEGLVVQ
jgi:hypothetical protein